MVNPQLEDGYTKIANEILEHLCRFRLPGGVGQIVNCVFRKTYGYHKKEDWISHSQIVEMTGMLKGNVSRELSKAITHKIVIESDNKLKLNKNLEEWINFGGNHFNPKKKLSNPITKTTENLLASEVIVTDKPVIVSDKKVIASEGNKRNYTKETIQKKNMASPDKNLGMSKLLEKRKAELIKPLEEKKTGIYYEWQEKALRYKTDLKLDLPAHAMGRWMKIFKQASLGRKPENIEKAYGYLKDHPRILDGSMSNEERMMFFFKIYELGTDWMQKKGERG